MEADSAQSRICSDEHPACSSFLREEGQRWTNYTSVAADLTFIRGGNVGSSNERGASVNSVGGDVETLAAMQGHGRRATSGRACVEFDVRARLPRWASPKRPVTSGGCEEHPSPGVGRPPVLRANLLLTATQSSSTLSVLRRPTSSVYAASPMGLNSTRSFSSPLRMRVLAVPSGIRSVLATS